MYCFKPYRHTYELVRTNTHITCGTTERATAFNDCNAKPPESTFLLVAGEISIDLTLHSRSV